MAKPVRELLAQRFPDREIIYLDDEPALAEVLPEVQILFGIKAPTEGWGRAEALRLIQSPGAGVDWLLPDQTLRPEVVVTNATGVHEPEMPEFIIAMLFAITKQIPAIVDQQRHHKWQIVIPTTLAGRTACIVGAGTIGQSVGRRLAALGMRVTGVRRSGEPVAGFERITTTDRRRDLLAEADVAIILSPLTDETVGLIGADDLAAMPEGSWLVDASRGTVSDLDAVVGALESGRLAGAAFDVFPTEPLPADSPYWDVPGLLIAPHTAGYSHNYFERVVDVLKANITALESGSRGEGFVNRVDRDRGY